MPCVAMHIVNQGIPTTADRRRTPLTNCILFHTFGCMMFKYRFSLNWIELNTVTHTTFSHALGCNNVYMWQESLYQIVISIFFKFSKPEFGHLSLMLQQLLPYFYLVWHHVILCGFRPKLACSHWTDPAASRASRLPWDRQKQSPFTSG